MEGRGWGGTSFQDSDLMLGQVGWKSRWGLGGTRWVGVLVEGWDMSLSSSFQVRWVWRDCEEKMGCVACYRGTGMRMWVMGKNCKCTRENISFLRQPLYIWQKLVYWLKHNSITFQQTVLKANLINKTNRVISTIFGKGKFSPHLSKENMGMNR